MNIRDWAKSHLKPSDSSVHDILMNTTLRGTIDKIVDLTDCSRYRAALLIQSAQREGYRL